MLRPICRSYSDTEQPAASIEQRLAQNSRRAARTVDASDVQMPLISARMGATANTGLFERYPSADLAAVVKVRFRCDPAYRGARAQAFRSRVEHSRLSKSASWWPGSWPEARFPSAPAT